MNLSFTLNKINKDKHYIRKKL